MLENSCQRLPGPSMAVLWLAPSNLRLFNFDWLTFIADIGCEAVTIAELDAPGSSNAREDLVDHLQGNHHGKADQEQLGGG